MRLKFYLVVGLGDAARVVGQVLLVAAQAGLQVLDGLRVVLVLWKGENIACWNDFGFKAKN